MMRIFLSAAALYERMGGDLSAPQGAVCKTGELQAGVAGTLQPVLQRCLREAGL